MRLITLAVRMFAAACSGGLEKSPTSPTSAAAGTDQDHNHFNRRDNRTVTARVATVAAIVGGSGRFAVATGTFTLRFIDSHDEAAATGKFSGSFEGRIDLNR